MSVLAQPRAFVASALAYGVVATLVRSVGFFAASASATLPNFIDTPTLWMGVALFAAVAVGLSVRPAAAASKGKPYGRALALFWVLHLGILGQSLSLPWGRSGAMETQLEYIAGILVGASGLMILCGAIAAFVAMTESTNEAKDADAPAERI